jgi:hemoglobin-like flavoprotein
MTPEQIDFVRKSHSWIRPIAEQVADSFYQRLFDTCPEVQPLFTSDVQEQGRKLMATIAVVVGALDKVDTLLPVVSELGARHADYGVKDEHYEQVGAALISTFKAVLGEKFSTEHQAAWLEAYNLLSNVMKEAGKAVVLVA